jgi:hypothetical protein
MAADLFRVVRTRVGTDGVTRTIASDPTSRNEAMARFDDCVTLRLTGVRVVREQDYRPSLVGAQPVKIRRGITGCSRWVPNRGACALSGGHDGACVPVEAQR